MTASQHSGKRNQATVGPCSETGLVYAKIWERQTEKDALYSGSFERRYKGKDEQWASTYSFKREDLLALAKLADQAHTEIGRLQTREAA
jgi:hypothetical protein